MKKLSPDEIEQELTGLEGWELDEGEVIVKEYQLGDFSDAMIFVNNVAQLAEELGHHPDIDIRYNKVLLRLTTHDSGGVTRKDLELADKIERI
jgi:4a-hydroxytetrahydrobiopterin dehydratase